MIRTVAIIAVATTFVAGLFGLVFWGGSSAISDIGGGLTIHEEEAGAQKQAPYFDLVDIEGKRVQVSSFHGEPLVIFFWTTWNGDAANQLKFYDDYMSHGNTFVKIVGIDSQEDPSIVHSYMRRGGYSVPIALDTQGVATGAYGVKALPTSFFIDRDGTIVAIFSGVLSESMIVDKAEAILK